MQHKTGKVTTSMIENSSTLTPEDWGKWYVIIGTTIRIVDTEERACQTVKRLTLSNRKPPIPASTKVRTTRHNDSEDGYTTQKPDPTAGYTDWRYQVYMPRYGWPSFSYYHDQIEIVKCPDCRRPIRYNWEQSNEYCAC